MGIKENVKGTGMLPLNVMNMTHGNRKLMSADRKSGDNDRKF